ncbi:unnamed protein product [Psylliodes chrysocephalus]|uniref:Uncharacterized protein n=1 Tax=Psylliodes chrysocephalus TaxID=3402493 RepID=A0A9P0CHU3_9CUCU|nr:unnamed protein product [Psylliodes chrysocephala]
MRCSVSIFLAILAIASALNDHEEWMHFKQNHGKMYKDRVEENFRFSVFQDNLRKIEEHNEKFDQGLSTFKMGMNLFGDLTAEEFLERQKLSKRNIPSISPKTENVEGKYDDDVPDTVNWVEKGAVTEVKNQGDCSSCWSFSTTGATEAAYFIKTGELIPLSQQNLVDCARDHCYGCSGCWMDRAMEYVEKNGIMKDGDYPYKGQTDEACLFNVSESVVKTKGHVFVVTGDEDDLKKAVARQPVTVAINTDYSFQFYQTGIFDNPNCKKDKAHLDHSILIVGYDTLEGVDVWLAKNSYGTSWGQKGYVWLSRNKDNQCGVASYAVYPVL